MDDKTKEKSEEKITNKLSCSFLAIGFLVIIYLVYTIFYYLEMDLPSKVSSFFGFLSTFSILVTLLVYFWQKKKEDQEKKEHIEQVGNFTLVELSKTLFSFQYLNENINGLCSTFKDKDTSDIEFKHFEGGFYAKNKFVTYYIKPIDTAELTSLCKYIFDFDTALYREISMIELSLVGLNREIIDACLTGTQDSLLNLKEFINHAYNKYDAKHDPIAWGILRKYKDYSKK